MDLTRQQARDLDRWAIHKLGIPGVVLMENAGRSIANLLLQLGVHGTVVLACGPGNNGGDGFVIARHLANADVPVRILIFASPEQLSGDAAINYQILLRSGFTVERILDPGDERLESIFCSADWVVDALFGTGLTRPLATPFDRIVLAMNAFSPGILSVDLPSGLDADTGVPLGPTIRAKHTATIVAPKIGFRQPSAQLWLGQVHQIDMGVPRRALQQFLQHS